MYRHLRGSKYPPYRQITFDPFNDRSVVLLGFFPPEAAVFYLPEEDCILGWPHVWKISRHVVTSVAGTCLRRIAVNIGSRLLGFLSDMVPVEGFSEEDQRLGNSSPSVSVVDPMNGAVIKKVLLPTPLSEILTDWTSGSLNHAPVLLPGGVKGENIIFMTRQKELFCVHGQTGTTLRVWSGFSAGFAGLVRSPIPRSGDKFTVLGVVCSDEDSHDNFHILDVQSGENLASISLLRGEYFVDAVAYQSGDKGLPLIACRVVSESERIVVVFYTRRSQDWQESRHTLCKSVDGTAVRASGELVMLEEGTGVLYRPETSVPFRGRIKVFQRITTSDICYSVHTLNYARVGGVPFRWARLSSDGRLLFAVAANLFCVFDMSRLGGCFKSFRVEDAASDLSDAFLMFSDHIIIALTEGVRRNVYAFHFGRFCRQPIPDCSLE